MSEKVRITQAQADAIETLRDGGIENGELVLLHVNSSGGGTATAEIIKVGLDDFIKAVYIGFEVEQPEYKVGDWVARADNKEFGNGGYACEVEGLGEETLRLKDRGGLFVDSFLRHATPEEIKAEQERRQWAKIGRSFRQIKEGDKYRVDCFERTVDGTNHSKGVLEECLDNGDVITFYPVESAIELGGAEE